MTRSSACESVKSTVVHIAGSSLGVLDAIGFALFAFGFVFEVIADAEKTAFRGKPDNKDKFITTGLAHNGVIQLVLL